MSDMFCNHSIQILKGNVCSGRVKDYRRGSSPYLHLEGTSTPTYFMKLRTNAISRDAERIRQTSSAGDCPSTMAQSQRQPLYKAQGPRFSQTQLQECKETPRLSTQRRADATSEPGARSTLSPPSCSCRERHLARHCKLASRY